MHLRLLTDDTMPAVQAMATPILILLLADDCFCKSVLCTFVAGMDSVSFVDINDSSHPS